MPDLKRNMVKGVRKEQIDLAKIKEQIDKAVKERTNIRERITTRQQNEKQDSSVYDTFKKASSILFSKYEERKDWKEKIRLSDSGKNDAFLDAVMDYLETLPNDTRRIEACNNIIKICRNTSVKLQKKGGR